MTTRYNASPQPAFGVAPLPTGYSRPASVPASFTIPPVGIEDVDRAIFKLFDTEIPLQVSDTDGGTKRVPIIFASGEKWALLRRGRPLRDKNKTLILPLITVMRNNLTQLPNEDIAGRGINQQVGEIVIRRRLADSDRSYQNLINRLFLRNQTNLAVNLDDGPIQDQLVTRRKIGELTDDPVIEDGGLLVSNRLDNVFETIVIPAPQFFTSTYEVTVWAQYTIQMNQIVENIISSFLPQGNAWKLDTQKGYWFIATVDGNLYTPETNFDDMSQEERMIKLKFNIKVPGYILTTSVPGAPVPIRRYVSSPVIQFETDVGTDITADTEGIEDPFLGADDPTLPLDDGKTRRRDQRVAGSTRLFPGSDNISPYDPARAALFRGTEPVRYRKIIGINKAGKRIEKFVRIKSVNRHTGEVIYASDVDLGGLTIIATEG